MAMSEQHDRATATPLQLTHAAVMSRHLEESVAFYRDILGLSLRTIEADPIREGRRRAMLLDGDGREVLEVIEMAELAHPSIPGRGGIHHIGFRLPKSAWQALRTRMDARGYSYDEMEGRLFVRDVDGLVLEIERE